MSARSRSPLAGVRDLGLRLVSRTAGGLGHQLVARDFYSPLPQIDNLPRRLWDGPHDLPGVDLRLEQAQALLAGELRGPIGEFHPPREPTPDGPTGSFYLANGAYESVDAEVLYGLLRQTKPRQVLELGSGASSHVIDLARRRNALDGTAFEHEVIDPFPFGNPMGPVEGLRVRRERAEDLDPSVVEPLAPGDVLFIDTTHTVKTGGDVAHIFLDLLPRVAFGVLVHVHDIFLPYEYPRDWVMEARRAWAEQYMLQAFLAFNPTWEIVFPAHAVARAAPQLVRQVIPSFEDDTRPGAFWMRRA